MSADHDLRRAHEDARNEHRLRLTKGSVDDGLLGPYLSPIRGELHRLVQAEPGLAFAGPDVLFARMTAPETAPGWASCLRRSALSILLVRAQDRAESMDPVSGGEDTAA